MQLKLEWLLPCGRRLDDDLLDQRADCFTGLHCIIAGQVLLDPCHCLLVCFGVVFRNDDRLWDRSGVELFAKLLLLTFELLEALHERLRKIVVLLDLANDLADASLKIVELVVGKRSALLPFPVRVRNFFLHHPHKASDQLRGE
ncbi:hypothetical protein [Sphingomonas sp. LHG3443-2]|uniref:hypothetical protein n=1 Tax=Sphingomonas sp. LHG3443-2 TaxID=2804639 RepID=UPI003CF10FD2